MQPKKLSFVRMTPASFLTSRNGGAHTRFLDRYGRAWCAERFCQSDAMLSKMERLRSSVRRVPAIRKHGLICVGERSKLRPLRTGRS
eukprot:scaffold297251_cov26-Tisochrysis_lutea.AAC.3